MAEDVLQESFVKIWRFAASYRPEASPPLTWMAAVARNTAIDGMRRKTEVLFAVDEEGRSEAENIADPATLQPTDALDMRALHRCLDSLDVEQRRRVGSHVPPKRFECATGQTDRSSSQISGARSA